MYRWRRLYVKLLWILQMFATFLVQIYSYNSKGPLKCAWTKKKYIYETAMYLWYSIWKFCKAKSCQLKIDWSKKIIKKSILRSELNFADPCFISRGRHMPFLDIISYPKRLLLFQFCSLEGFIQNGRWTPQTYPFKLRAGSWLPSFGCSNVCHWSMVTWFIH